eukprot:907739-Rhodomonas_salina.3
MCAKEKEVVAACLAVEQIAPSQQLETGATLRREPRSHPARCPTSTPVDKAIKPSKSALNIKGMIRVMQDATRFQHWRRGVTWSSGCSVAPISSI